MAGSPLFVRLLVCRACATVNEIPDYEGPPDRDELLMREVSRHQQCTPQGARVGGTSPQEAQSGDRFLARIEAHIWHDQEKRQDVLAQMGLGHTGFDQRYYDVRNNLREDAMSCFNQHNRPKGFCIDWKDESKVVGNGILDHEEQTLIIREGLRRVNRKVHLCDMCPVASTVQTAKNYKRGLYDK